MAHYSIYKCSQPVLILSRSNRAHDYSTALPDDSFKYYPPFYAQVFQVVSFARVPDQICVHLSCTPSMPNRISRMTMFYTFTHLDVILICGPCV
jgi:hypothetical protein